MPDTLSERDLVNAIDDEAHRTLANRLPEVLHAFEAQGLGRSGAGQQAMLQAQKEILEQANRDKMKLIVETRHDRRRYELGTAVFYLLVLLMGVGLGMVTLAADTATSDAGIRLLIGVAAGFSVPKLVAGVRS